MKKLRNKEDVEDEIEELRQEDLAEKDEKQMNALKLLTCPDLQQQALNVMALACSQQLGGVNAVRKALVQRLRVQCYLSPMQPLTLRRPSVPSPLHDVVLLAPLD